MKSRLFPKGHRDDVRGGKGSEMMTEDVTALRTIGRKVIE